MLGACQFSGDIEETNDAYGMAKLAGIKMCQAYHRQYGANFISVISANVYGLGDHFDENGRFSLSKDLNSDTIYFSKLSPIGSWTKRGFVKPQWPLPENDYWSTPFAEVLLSHLDIFPGATVLDVAAGSGIPAFHIAEQVGPAGRVLAVDIHQHQVLRSRSRQGRHLPWLQFEVGDMRQLPPDLPHYDRITGNLSFMFFRPHRFEALQNLVRFLKPGGQIVLTFPSLGTFDSLWNQVNRAMTERGFENERKALIEYIEERPSADQARQWLLALGMEKVEVADYPLEIATRPGRGFLEHPLLRGGFLDDIYECFKDQRLAEEFMTELSNNIESFTPLFAQRCAMSGWLPT